jgi:hypothetical protein
MKFVLIGVLALIAIIMAVPQLNLQWNILGALLIVAFGFLFVTVSVPPDRVRSDPPRTRSPA